MATGEQPHAVKRNIKKTAAGAQESRSSTDVAAETRTVVGKPRALVGQPTPTDGPSPQAPQERGDETKPGDLPIRSKMILAELARARHHQPGS